MGVAVEGKSADALQPRRIVCRSVTLGRIALKFYCMRACLRREPKQGRGGVGIAFMVDANLRDDGDVTVEVSTEELHGDYLKRSERIRIVLEADHAATQVECIGGGEQVLSVNGRGTMVEAAAPQVVDDFGVVVVLLTFGI